MSSNSTEDTLLGQVQDHSKECQSPLHVTLSDTQKVGRGENTEPPLASSFSTVLISWAVFGDLISSDGKSKLSFICKSNPKPLG